MKVHKDEIGKDCSVRIFMFQIFPENHFIICEGAPVLTLNGLETVSWWTAFSCKILAYRQLTSSQILDPNNKAFDMSVVMFAGWMLCQGLYKVEILCYAGAPILCHQFPMKRARKMGSNVFILPGFTKGRALAWRLHPGTKKALIGPVLACRSLDISCVSGSF